MCPRPRPRADDSRSYQRLIQWLPRDALSTPPNQFDFNDPPGSASCAGATGVNLVHMSWQGGPEHRGRGVQIGPRWLRREGRESHVLRTRVRRHRDHRRNEHTPRRGGYSPSCRRQGRRCDVDVDHVQSHRLRGRGRDDHRDRWFAQPGPDPPDDHDDLDDDFDDHDDHDDHDDVDPMTEATKLNRDTIATRIVDSGAILVLILVVAIVLSLVVLALYQLRRRRPALHADGRRPRRHAVDGPERHRLRGRQTAGQSNPVCDQCRLRGSGRPQRRPRPPFRGR